MLKNLLNSFTSPTTVNNYSVPSTYYPGNYGGGGIPQGINFSGLLNSLIPFGGSGGATQQFGGGGMQQFGGGMQQGGRGILSQAINAFTNARGQGDVINVNRNNIRKKAFAPGAILINSNQGLAQGQISPPQPFGIAQNQFAALNPLQGFAGQNNTQGINPQFSQPNQFAYAPNSSQGGIGGMLQMLLLPLMGVFGAIKSLFGLKRTFANQEPIKINKEDLSYFSYQDYVDKAYEPGQFDEADLYEGKGFAESNDYHTPQNDYFY